MSKRLQLKVTVWCDRLMSPDIWFWPVLFCLNRDHAQTFQGSEDTQILISCFYHSKKSFENFKKLALMIKVWSFMEWPWKIICKRNFVSARLSFQITQIIIDKMNIERNEIFLPFRIITVSKPRSSFELKILVGQRVFWLDFVGLVILKRMFSKEKRLICYIRKM